MKQTKYQITTNVTGVIFLNSNDGSKTITLEKGKYEPFSDEDKLEFSDDLEVYGPKIVLVGNTAKTKTSEVTVAKTNAEKIVSKKDKSSKEVKTKTSKKSSKKTVSTKTKVKKVDEVKEEIEKKLDGSQLSKVEIKAKVKALKLQYASASTTDEKIQIKKKIESLIDSISA